jgi:hypothetical protein
MDLNVKKTITVLPARTAALVIPRIWRMCWGDVTKIPSLFGSADIGFFPPQKDCKGGVIILF